MPQIAGAALWVVSRTDALRSSNPLQSWHADTVVAIDDLSFAVEPLPRRRRIRAWILAVAGAAMGEEASVPQHQVVVRRKATGDVVGVVAETFNNDTSSGEVLERMSADAARMPSEEFLREWGLAKG